MLEKIYIARHGFRLNWVTTTWLSKTGLPRDPPLAAYGETQARELAEYFRSLPEKERPTAIFSSPYYRCLQTAQPTSIALGIPIYVEHGIAEWYSPVVPGTGLHPRPGSAESLEQYFPEIDRSWSSVWYPSRKGEDVDEVHDRIDGFLQAFAVQLERKFAGKHSRILLVSHAATVIALARSLIPGTENTWGSWRPQRLADGSHLADGASREWGFEDIEISKGKVVEDPGVPGTELTGEQDEPVGSQIQLSSNL
ncbi:putative phosphoglycerate mutase-like protein [Lyophyllum shimeji]|uniref:Phosphoglycerate mutase-like protein n=1 Tax=Lyophyllum shimeji TaxID=47721 RepID=A0A9P3PHT6_LYOSH|nr:putative phosphoglycerate mutase-like protein [Lyophyllum shimeji]